MEFVELKKHLKSSAPYPCYFCYGDDDFVLSRAVALISEKATGIKEFNIVDREFSKGELLIEELMQLPVMSEHRIVIARGKTDTAAVEAYLKDPNPSSVLVLVEYVPHDSWSKTQSPAPPAGATPVACSRLPIKYVYPFVRSAAEKSSAAVSDEAISELYARCGGYMTRIDQESKKLALLCSGREITPADVAANVKADTEYVVYELGDSILRSDCKRALEIADGMAKNNDLTAAFTLLYNRFRRIFAASVDYDGLAGLGVKPYMAAKLRGEGDRLSKAKLKKLIDMLAEADKSYKTGAMSQYDALTYFISRAAYGGAD